MIHLILSWLWSSALAQFGIAGIVLVGSIVVFIQVPLASTRHLAVGVASVCIIFLFLGPKLYIEGINHERAKWEAANVAAEKRATGARREAEQEIAAQPMDVGNAAAPPPTSLLQRMLHPGRVRNKPDKFDRDKP